MKLILVLTLTIHLTQTREITLESLDDGPGLLPFKLGTANLITHYHTFLQYIELTDIENKITTIKTQINDIKNLLTKEDYPLYEIQIEHIYSKLTKAYFQLRSLEPNSNRVRRGLIDGLGSVIKSITGNLDSKDAEIFNNAIAVSNSNENRLAAELNSHISLGKNWMTQHTKVITQLTKNQASINSTLQLLLNNSEKVEEKLMYFARFAQVLSIVSENIDDLLSELYRIEDMLAFVRASSTHHSMLRIDVLGSMISKLKKLYNNDQILDLDRREYYSIIKPGSFYNRKQVVIVFRFPIISPKLFTFYKLSIVPNRYNVTLIPPFPYIATCRDSYVYVEAECPKYNTRYLCEEKTNHQVRTQPDCILHLINEQSVIESCKKTAITLTRAALEKLDDRSYALVFPQPTKVQQICGREDYNTYHGSYLATIPQGCSLRTPQFTIINVNDHIEGQPVKIMKVPASNRNVTSVLSALNLSTVDLKGIEEKILHQSPVQLEKTSDYTMYHTTIPFYVVLSATCLLIVILSLRHGLLRCVPCKESRRARISPDENAKTPDETPATFSLNVLK